MIDNIQNIDFLYPYWLLFGLAPIFWYVVRFWKKLEDKALLTFSNTKSLKDAKTWRTKILWLPDLLRLLALLLFTLAMARPQVTLKEEIVKAEGIDIMLSMDLSSSMLAQDFNPNRLEVSKQVATEFVGKRPHDRIGLTVFAGEAFTQCPLTTDDLILTDFLGNITVGTLNDGTAIGMGLATAINRLKDSKSKSKIVILLTDGVNNSGYIDPITAAEIAKEYEVKVYTIGVGSEGRALTPVNRRSNGEYFFSMSRVQIDEDLLSEISRLTGGKYYRAIDRSSLEQIYDEINYLEKTEIETSVFKRYEEKFRFFLIIGLILFFLELLLRNTILKIVN